MFKTYDWPLQSEDSFCRIWASETIVLSEHFDPRPPDLPGLDPEELGRQYVAGATAMHRSRPRFRLRKAHTPDAEQDERVTRAIEVAIGSTQGVPVVRTLLRLPMEGQPDGYCFIGALTIPLADTSWIIKVQACETQMTGFRETLARVMWLRENPDWAKSPGMSGVENLLAVDYDAAEYDTTLDEPLTAARAYISEIEQSLRFRPEVFEQPAFRG